MPDYLSAKERAMINSIKQRYSTNPSIPEIDTSKEADVEDITKLIATIVGEKGDGKTTIAMTFPGKIFALSYDHKTERVAKQFVRLGLKKQEDIHVANPMKYRFGFVDDQCAAGYLNTLEAVKILGNIEPGKWDFILFDGTEIMIKQAEMKMRYENNIPPNAGIANRSLWNDRRMTLQRLYDMAHKIANVGVIFTAYWDYADDSDDNGKEAKKKNPKWTDVVKHETDLLIEASHQVYNGKATFFADIITSKDDFFIKTGTRYNVTNYAPLISPNMIETYYPDLYKASTLAGESQSIRTDVKPDVKEEPLSPSPNITAIKDKTEEWQL